MDNNSHPKVTKHADQRLKERCGFNSKARNRMAERAFREGITQAQTKGKLNKWMTKLYFNNMNANNIRIYGEKAYIFCDETLVTVLSVPAELKKDIKNIELKRKKGN